MRITLLTSIIWAMFGYALPAVAQVPTEGRVLTKTLNVRSKASTDGRQYCSLDAKSNLPIKIISRSKNGWYQIDLTQLDGRNCHGHETGWIAGLPYFEETWDVKTGMVVGKSGQALIKGGATRAKETICKLSQGAPVKVISKVGDGSWSLVDLRDNSDICGRSIGFIETKHLIEAEKLEKKRPLTEIVDIPASAAIEQEETDDSNSIDPDAVPEDVSFPTPSSEEESATNAAGLYLECNGNCPEAQPVAGQGIALPATPREMIKAFSKSYSESEQVKNMLEAAQSYREYSSIGKCFMYVKNALLHGPLADKYLSGGSAVGADRELRNQGFVNLLKNKDLKKLIKSPYDAPKGAILVYEGHEKSLGRPLYNDEGKITDVNFPHGHIEIKVGDVGEGGFVSDYYNDKARTGNSDKRIYGNGRRLIGVYIKENI